MKGFSQCLIIYLKNTELEWQFHKFHTLFKGIPEKKDMEWTHVFVK